MGKDYGIIIDWQVGNQKGATNPIHEFEPKKIKVFQFQFQCSFWIPQAHKSISWS